jgi:hypothetical protein
MNTQPDKEHFTCEQFIKDVQFTAELMGARYNHTLTENLVGLFKNKFEKCVIQWKITDKINDGLYYRFLSTDLEDLVKQAQDAKLFNCSNQKLIDIQQNIIDLIPAAQRSGIDFEAEKGLAKAWTYTSPIPVSLALRIPGLPQVFYNNEALYNQLCFDGVGFVASDFINQSVTVYFGWILSPVNHNWLTRLQELTSFTIEENLIEEILRFKDEIRGVSITFDWEKNKIQRCGIYRFDFSFEDKSAQLPQLPTRFLKLINEAPTLNFHPCYHWAWSIGEPSTYRKLEKNYAKDVYDFLNRERGIKL